MSVQRDKRGNGWVTRWLEDGRHRSKKFELKRDADAFELEVKRRQQLGPIAVQQLTDRGPTLQTWIEEHWLPEHGVGLESSTLERYAGVYELYIAPTFDQVPIREISVSRLRAWQANLVKCGVGEGTIKKARTALSSYLRHAAESEAIPGNPLGLVRAPKSAHRDGVRPVPPTELELILASLRNPPPRQVDGSGTGQRARRAYSLPAPGTISTRRRDAIIAALIGYAGLRPGKIRGLRFDDIRDNTIRVERAADDYGNVKRTKTGQTRSVRLLAPLAQDLREYRLAAGRPAGQRLIVAHDDGSPWGKSDWNMWVADRWKPACRSAGLAETPRPYDLRHSFASLLLAEGRQPLWVARQLGHSVQVLLTTYAHLIDEYEEAVNVDAEVEIAAARRNLGCVQVASELHDREVVSAASAS